MQKSSSRNLPDWLADELGVPSSRSAGSGGAKAAGQTNQSSTASTIKNQKELEKVIKQIRNYIKSQQYTDAMTLVLDTLRSPVGTSNTASIRLLRLQAQIDLLQADELLSKRQLTAASYQYRKTMESCAKVLSLSKSGNMQDLDISADALNGLATALELRGNFEGALVSMKEHLQVLQRLPAVEMKKARARRKILELEEAVKSSWHPKP